MCIGLEDNVLTNEYECKIFSNISLYTVIVERKIEFWREHVRNTTLTYSVLMTFWNIISSWSTCRTSTASSSSSYIIHQIHSTSNTMRLLLGLHLRPANLHSQVQNEMCIIHSYNDIWNRKRPSTPCEQASLLSVDQQVAFRLRHLLLFCQKYPAHHTNICTNLSLNCQQNLPKGSCFSVSSRICTFNTLSPSL